MVVFLITSYHEIVQPTSADSCGEEKCQKKT